MGLGFILCYVVSLVFLVSFFFLFPTTGCFFVCFNPVMKPQCIGKELVVIVTPA